MWDGVFRKTPFRLAPALHLALRPAPEGNRRLPLNESVQAIQSSRLLLFPSSSLRGLLTRLIGRFWSRRSESYRDESRRQLHSKQRSPFPNFSRSCRESNNVRVEFRLRG